MTTIRRGGRRSRSRRFELPRPPLGPAAALFLLALTVSLLFPVRPGRRKVPVPETLPPWIREELLPVNDWSRPGTAMEAVNGIVVHYVGNPGTTAEQNRAYFAGLARSHETYASSNFIIGLEGEVLLCVPMGEVAYCSNDRNGDTLSIEVCHPDESGQFTQASRDSLIRLITWLQEFYDLGPEQVIRHYDVMGKLCPKYYVEHPEEWEKLRGELRSKDQN